MLTDILQSNVEDKMEIAGKLQLMKVWKIAIGSMAAVIIAGVLNLSYVTSAGVITLLSIQNTKRETVFVMLKRVAAFFVAVLIAFASFSILGYEPLALGVFLLLFVGTCQLCSFQDAIAMNTVLVTHFYVEQSMSRAWIQNEMMLLLVGAGIGVLLNLYIPDNSSVIRKAQREIEGAMKGILGRMSSVLLQESKEHYDGTCFLELDEMLARAYKEAVANRDNRLLTDTRYYLNYMNMRMAQTYILKRIYENICLLNTVPSQTYAVSQFIRKISEHFRESNNAVALLERLEELKQEMKEEALPVTREEFENRAVLYRILYDLEEFLEEKRRFVEELGEKEKQIYWEN